MLILYFIHIFKQKYDLSGSNYLQHKEASVEDARVNESCTELTTLEELISILEEQIVWIKHDHPVILH